MTSRAELPAFADSIDAPRVMAGAVPGPIRFGRAVLTPSSGARVWILAAGDRPCALWLDGDGTLEYVIDDPVVLPVAVRNLKTASSLDSISAADRVVVRERANGAILWSWELAAGATRSDAGPTPPAFPAWASKALDDRWFTPPSHDLAEAAANGASGVVYALIDGARELIVVSVDPRPSVATEFFWVAWRLPPVYRVFAGRLSLQTIAVQPIARAISSATPADVIARRFELDVFNSEGRAIRVKSATEIESKNERLRLWRAALTDETYDDGRVYPVRVHSVSVDGRPASYLHRDGELLVELPTPLSAGQAATVRVEHEGELAVRPDADNYWYLSGSAWHPRPAANRDTLAEFEISMDVPAPYTPYASGTTSSRRSEAGRNRLTSVLKGPMRYAVVAAGKYQEVSGDAAGTAVNVASYVFGKESEAKRLINNFEVIKTCFEQLWGVPYPFDELDIVEINSWGMGHAPPGVIFVTKEAFTKAGMVQVLGGSSVGANELLSHEFAHAYWSHVVKWNSDEEQWLSESFAEYTSTLCLQMAAEDERQGKRIYERSINGWRGSAGMIGDGASLYLANFLAFRDDKDSVDRYLLLYNRGPLVLHGIRQELARQSGGAEKGDKYFAAFLRAIVRNFTYAAPTTRDLVGILEQMTQRPWQPYFDRYVYGTETPKVN